MQLGVLVDRFFKGFIRLKPFVIIDLKMKTFHTNDILTISECVGNYPWHLSESQDMTRLIKNQGFRLIFGSVMLDPTCKVTCIQFSYQVCNYFYN